MANEEFLVVADLDGSAQESRIFLAAPITAAEIEDLYADRIVDEQLVQRRGRQQQADLVQARGDGGSQRRPRPGRDQHDGTAASGQHLAVAVAGAELRLSRTTDAGAGDRG